MTIAVTAAHGAQIQIGNGATSESFAVIEGVHNGPNGPGWEPAMIEARHHSSDSTIRKVSTINKTAVTFSVYTDSTDTEHQLLITNAAAGTKTNFKMILTDEGSEQYTFGAYISISRKAGVDEFNVMDVTLSIDGDITVS